MPSMISEMAKTDGLDVFCDMIAFGGFSLSQYLEEKTAKSKRTIKKLLGEEWDYVVLQDRSGGPGGSFVGPVHVVFENVPGPPAAVFYLKTLDCVKQIKCSGALPGTDASHDQLAGFGNGDPGLICNAPTAEAGFDEFPPAIFEARSGALRRKDAGQHRIEPVHGVSGL